MSDTTPPLERLAFTVDETLQIVPVGRSTLYALIGSGQLHTIKARGRRLIPRASLEAFIAGGGTDAA
jgi:excisionase family DNA binding protein